MNARQDLSAVLLAGGAATNALASGLIDAYRVEVRREVLAEAAQVAEDCDGCPCNSVLTVAHKLRCLAAGEPPTPAYAATRGEPGEVTQ